MTGGPPSESGTDEEQSTDTLIWKNLAEFVHLLDEMFDPKEVERLHRDLGMHGLIDIESEFSDDVFALLSGTARHRRAVLRRLHKRHARHHMAEAVLLLAILALRRVLRMQELWRRYPSLSTGRVTSQAACADAYALSVDLGVIFDYRFPYDVFEKVGNRSFTESSPSSTG